MLFLLAAQIDRGAFVMALDRMICAGILIPIQILDLFIQVKCDFLLAVVFFNC